MSNGEGTRGKIPVIDDEVVITDLVARTLSTEGFSALVASSGSEGLAAAESERPDLIFVDIGMPDMSGYDVTASFKSHSEWATVPVIYITGRTAAEDGGRSSAGRGLSALRKPFSTKQLRDLVGLTLETIAT